jgi:CPA1 family monovalent cation:H+ antiporter
VKIKEIDDIIPEDQQAAGIKLRMNKAALERLNDRYIAEVKENELVGFLKQDLEEDISLTRQRLDSLECDETQKEEVDRYNAILKDIYHIQRLELFKLKKEKFFSDEEIRKMEMQLDLDEVKISGNQH